MSGATSATDIPMQNNQESLPIPNNEAEDECNTAEMMIHSQEKLELIHRTEGSDRKRQENLDAPGEQGSAQRSNRDTLETQKKIYQVAGKFNRFAKAIRSTRTKLELKQS